MNGFLFGGLFWGVLLILFGISVIVKTVFHIDLHLGRVFFAAIVILFGISLLTGRGMFRSHVYREKSGVTTIFSSDEFENGPIQRQYNIIFGKDVIDLRAWDPEKDPINIEVSVIFGSAELLLPRDTQTTLKGTTIFGASNYPDGNTAAFGEKTFRQDGSRGGHSLYIEANTIFGSLIASD
ncbi:MAG: hypothetical protein JEY99_04750 [Spirochaetales bacterium]|nr:hypothetical protein [Spirochaetales bacterium]